MTQPYRIFVDADACPVVDEIIKLAEKANKEVVVVHSRHHNIVQNHDHVTVHETGDRADAADHYIFNHFSPGDLVVTDDLGLASMVLSRGGEVIRFRGDRTTNENIDMRLAMREASRRERSKSNRVKGPSEYSEEDRQRFVHSLEQFLRNRD